MKFISRRESLRRISLAGALAFWPVAVPRTAFAGEAEPQPVPTEEEMGAMEKIALDTMTQCGVPGLSVAIARHGQMVYRQGFGVADKNTQEMVTPASLFRIASVTKPITSVAIFTLIERGRLGLEDLVFGAQGILKFDYANSYSERVSKIKVHHLLTHTGGGWSNDGKLDPMFYRPDMNHQELISWTLQNQPLDNEPGEKYDYSNFGYCLLGRIIEKIAGCPYAQFVRENVLAKCGIDDMRVGGNTLAERAEGEVVYYGSPKMGTNPYNMNITRMDSHGGWIATPTDLVKFAMHVDGFTTTPNILRPETIKAMTTATTANPHYACGWCVNSIPNWWHMGSLPGTLSIMVRTASGLCWAALINTRVEVNLDEMMWKMAKAVPAWRA